MPNFTKNRKYEANIIESSNMGAENSEMRNGETKNVGNMGEVYRATAKYSPEEPRKSTAGKMPGEEEMESSEDAGKMPER